MSPLAQRLPDPRDDARAEAHELLRGFRGALSSMSAAERAEIASRAEEETVGNQHSMQDTDSILADMLRAPPAEAL
jgi:hypothetical protein